MTVAAVKTLTETNRVNLGGKVEMVTGTVTIVTTLDWVDLSTLNPALGTPIEVKAFITASGVDGEAFMTADKVYFTGTGAMTVMVIAPSAESTGGD